MNVTISTEMLNGKLPRFVWELVVECRKGITLVSMAYSNEYEYREAMVKINHEIHLRGLLVGETWERNFRFPNVES
jgi:hypothetical protein